MAGKSRRVASRQAQLSRKRKKTQKGPGPAIPAPSLPVEADGKHAEAVPDAAPVVPEPAAPPRSPAARRPSPVASRSPVAAGAPTRTPTRVRGERPPTQQYVGAEARRIVALASVVLAVIIALAVVL